MILKLRIASRPHAAHGAGGWRYIDDVVSVETHETPALEDGSRHAFTAEGLRQFVTEGWGPHDVRTFAFEVWPQDATDDFCRYATFAVLTLSSGEMVFVVATEDCFLLGDDGRTIDRIV